MAATAVFDLPELLDLILLNLDMKTLLLSQRVNKQWKATIDGSPNLQDQLFIKLKDHRGKDGVDAINPLLVKQIQQVPYLITHHTPRNLPRALPGAAIYENMKCVFAFDLSTLSADASARKMTLSWCKRGNCPDPETKFMLAIGENLSAGDAPIGENLSAGDAPGWIVAVDEWRSDGKMIYTGEMERAVAVGLMRSFR
nr:hypothetical protein B0A51_01730 [Rachicladosporium sp. CCFEE 5018]